MRRIILPALALALASAACGEAEPAEDSTSGAASGMCAADAADCVDVVVEGEPAGDAMMAPDIPIVEALQQLPRLIIAEPGATDGSFPIFLREATLDGSTLRVSFSGGHPPCFVVDTAEVVERDDAVIVNVRAGAAKGTDQASCTTDVEMQYVEIELADELGTRALLNGSLVVQDDVQN